MAIYNAGYLSPFKNKLGNAVGRKWRTLDVIAVYNGTPRNPNTQAQQLVRTRMTALSKLAAVCSAYIKAGFFATCDGTKVPPRAKFIKENWEAVQASAPGTTVVSWADLMLSTGGLPTPAIGTPDFSNPNEVECTNTDNSDAPGADSHDIIYFGAFDAADRAFLGAETITRSDASVKIEFTQWWNGRTVHLYAFAVGDGNDNKGMTSETVYVGSGTVQ